MMRKSGEDVDRGKARFAEQLDEPAGGEIVAREKRRQDGLAGSLQHQRMHRHHVADDDARRDLDLDQVARPFETPLASRRVGPLHDAGMRGDLLTLRVALAPCVVGYAEIATRLAARPGARAATNPYRVWIEEYAGAPYQEVAASARGHLDRLASLYVTPAREAELVATFKEATRLETDFWDMGWRMGLRGA